MASTAIPAVKAAILKALEETEGLEGVTVTAGKEPERAKEFVWLTRAKAHREFKVLGPAPTLLNEEVRATLWIVAFKGGKDPTASEERAFAILEDVETAIREVSALAPFDAGHIIEDLDSHPRLDDRTWGYSVEATILVKTRI